MTTTTITSSSSSVTKEAATEADAATAPPPANANSECVGPSSESAGTASACAGCPNQSACASGALQSPEALAQAETEVQQLKASLSCVSHTILVLSGKGGVGKSTIAAQLAHTLASQGYAVGLLDVDLCGPSAPRMILGEQAAATQTIHKSASGLWIPVYSSATKHNLAVVSISFLLQDRNQAVIWRGPRKNALILQFLSEVDWTGETQGLDYLIVDTPPGTSDEHISTVQYLQKAGHTSGAVVVTTPEEASLADVRKELSFCAKTKVPILGVIENMGTLETRLDQLQFHAKTTKNETNSHSADCTEHVLNLLRAKCPEVLTDYTVTSNLFTLQPGKTAQMAAAYQCDFWGSLPLDPALLQACDQGHAFVEQQRQAGTYPTNKAAQALDEFCRKLTKACPVDMAE